MYTIEQKPASKNAWFTPTESNNYYKERYSRKYGVPHWWGGGEKADKHDAIVAYFLRQSQAGVKSVNFVVSDIKITEMVHPDNVAWCQQNGNPVGISFEFQPTLSDPGYKRGGWLIATLEKKYGHILDLKGHNYWFATQCPGTIDIARLRREADAAKAGTLPAPAPVPAAPPAPARADFVTLPASAGPWRVYPLNKTPVVGNEVAKLRPDIFGGLTYQILGRPYPNTVTIRTQDYGTVNIWVGPETPAQFSYQTQTTPGAAAKAPLGTHTISLSASVERWRVYPLDKVARVGNEVGFLLPKKYGGLTYNILGNPAPNVYTIQTRDLGKVNIFADGDATIRKG